MPGGPLRRFQNLYLSVKVAFIFVPATMVAGLSFAVGVSWEAVLRYLFEDFALDVDRRELLRGTAPILSSRRFSTCFTLIQNRERRSRNEHPRLFGHWRGRIVS